MSMRPYSRTPIKTRRPPAAVLRGLASAGVASDPGGPRIGALAVTLFCLSLLRHSTALPCRALLFGPKDPHPLQGIDFSITTRWTVSIFEFQTGATQRCTGTALSGIRERVCAGALLWFGVTAHLLSRFFRRQPYPQLGYRQVGARVDLDRKPHLHRGAFRQYREPGLRRGRTAPLHTGSAWTRSEICYVGPPST